MDDLTVLNASEMVEKFREGDLSVVDVIEAHIQRIETVNPKINAVILPLFERARAEAKEADKKYASGGMLGPLHGVPITIKDQFHIKGLPTTFGVARLKNQLATEDGAMVAALRTAGGIILGKTNVPQTLSVVETNNAIWGRTNNPWDLSRTSGGSSGGEAAIVSAGGSLIGLGCDYGGSIRLPAAWCGIYGLKPTARRLYADSAPVRTARGRECVVTQPGPLARSVADLILAFRLMVNHVVAHPTGSNPPLPFREPNTIEINHLRVALLPKIGEWSPAPPIQRALQEASDALRAQGATVEEWTTAPNTQKGVNLFFNIVGADGFSWVKQILDGEKPVPLMKPSVQVSSLPGAIIPVAATLLRMTGQHHLSRMLRNMRQQSAEGLMNLLGNRLDYETHFVTALDIGNYDAILCPALPLPAVHHGDVSNLADFWGSMLLFNTLGMPAGVAPITRVRPDEEGNWLEGKDKAEQTGK